MSRDYARQRRAARDQLQHHTDPIAVETPAHHSKLQALRLTDDILFGGTACHNGNYEVEAVLDSSGHSPLTIRTAQIISPVSPAVSKFSPDAEHEFSMDPAQPAKHSPNYTEQNLKNLLRRPFELRHGRRYLRELSYPLPCDLPELHRQNVRTLLACAVFGRPVCSPNVLLRPPRRVLEVGCGSAFWSSSCHKMFSSMGYDHIMYTGLDIAPLAPDLRRQGLNWTFIQHDIRRCPWPLNDESYDYIMCKDLSLAIPLGNPSQQVLDECIRLLVPGGTLEIWESDHVTRTVLPHQPPIPVSGSDHDLQVAEETATFSMSPTTPFAPAHNRFLKAANKWISDALGERRLPPTPCARIAPILLQEPDSLGYIGFRRVAIPLSELRWEEEDASRGRTERSRSRARRKSVLNVDQLALRQTALLTVVQMIESLEPILKVASGKNSEEWSYWWASMMSNLSDPEKKPLNGECLELGAWWATKIDGVG